MADLDGGVVGALDGDVGGGAKGPRLLDFAVAADGSRHGLLRLDRVPQALTEGTERRVTVMMDGLALLIQDDCHLIIHKSDA